MKSLMWTAVVRVFTSLGYPQSSSPKAIRISPPFFPPHTFYAEPDQDSFVLDWYSRHLTALREPSLWEISKSSKQQIYRFLWLRTFHAPIAIRLNINADGTGILTTKISNGKGGYEAGRLTKNKSKKLSKDEAQCFLYNIEGLEFWNLPSREDDANVGVYDGAHWIMEAVRDGTYKIVDRCSPEQGPVRVLGLMMLLDLAKLELLFKEVY